MLSGKIFLHMRSANTRNSKPPESPAIRFSRAWHINISYCVPSREITSSIESASLSTIANTPIEV